MSTELAGMRNSFHGQGATQSAFRESALEALDVCCAIPSSFG